MGFYTFFSEVQKYVKQYSICEDLVYSLSIDRVTSMTQARQQVQTSEHTKHPSEENSSLHSSHSFGRKEGVISQVCVRKNEPFDANSKQTFIKFKRQQKPIRQYKEERKLQRSPLFTVFYLFNEVNVVYIANGLFMNMSEVFIWKAYSKDDTNYH